MERFLLRSALGGMRKAESARGLPRSRPRLSAAAGVLSHLLDVLDVQHLRLPLRQHARLRRHDFRRGYGKIPQIESGILGRKLLLGAVAALAHGGICRNHRESGVSVFNIDAAGIFSTPEL